MAQTITADEKKGRELIFSVFSNYKKGISDADFAREKAFYCDVLVTEPKTRPQLDQEAVRSENALLIVQRKELETIVALQAKIIEGHEALKAMRYE